MAKDDVRLSEVLFEFQRVNNYVRVSAIDTRTNVEVKVVGAVGYSDDALKRLAMQKLKYVIAKRRAQGQLQDDGEGDPLLV